MTSTQIVEVVASGSLERVEHWGELLRKAKIQFEMRRSFDEHRPTRRNYAELWVERDKVERARSIIRGAGDAGETLLW
jgi:hypothetical protein